MTRHSRALAGVLATVALVAVFGSGSATASRSLERTTEANVRGLALAITIESTVNITCEMTLAFSLHRLISKVEGALAGHVQTASVGRCSGGTARVLNASLPWHIRYRAFTGTLPSPTTILVRIFGTAMLGEALGVSCLYTGTLNGIATGVNPGEFLSLRIEEGETLFYVSGGIFCTSTAAVRGGFAISPTVRTRLV